MPYFRPPIACVLLASFGLSSAGVCASVLYKCDTGDGSIAYTSSEQGYTNCKAISVVAESTKPPAATANAAPPPIAPAASTQPKRGWVYEEQAREPAKAEFSGVIGAVASDPADIERANFSAATGGVATSPPILPPQDFSTVLVDVTSDALMIGTPLIIAAPYRPPPARTDPVRRTQPQRAQPQPAQPQLASAAAPPMPRTLRGSVYKVERKDGITEYTNIRPRGATFAVLFTYIATCVACDIHSKIDFARTVLNLDAFKDEITAAAADYGVESSLLRAVIHAESAFNPMALSNKGAQGLMQLMPGTAGDLGVTDAFDITQNIRGGARYLAQLLRNFNGDSQLATAAYNAGPGAVQKYGGVPPYDETQVYVQRVATLRERYQKAM